MAEEGEGSVSAARYGEGAIRKATRRNGRYGLEGSGSEGCGNNQASFG